jgi:hypothetical protein
MMGEHDAVYNNLAHRLRLALSLEQVRWELATSDDHLLDAIASAPERGLDPALAGRNPHLD